MSDWADFLKGRNPALPDPKDLPRVGGVIVPNHPQPQGEVDVMRRSIDDLRNSIAGLQQELVNMRLANQVRDDWSRIVDLDTNSAATTRIMASQLTGGRPFSGFTVLSIGGGSLVVSINGQAETPALMAGDLFRDEIIWTLDFRTTSQASGTARIRLNAYVGR